MIRNLSLSIFMMALSGATSAATDVLLSTSQINEAQFGAAAKKISYEMTFNDGKKENISSCGDYVQAKKTHGDVVDLSSSPQDFYSLVANLPLCEVNDYIQASNQKIQPSPVKFHGINLPAKFFWAISNSDEEKIQAANRIDTLKKFEPQIKFTEDNRYLAETKIYAFTSYGKLSNGDHIIKLSNSLTDGALKNTRYYVISFKQKNIKIIKEFSVLN